MDKTTTRVLLVASLYVSGVSTALLGLMLNYLIPRGGPQGGAGFLALGRHDWADIHAFFALVFVIIAVTHAVGNRNQVSAYVRKTLLTKSSKAVYLVLLAPVALIVLGWLAALVF